MKKISAPLGGKAYAFTENGTWAPYILPYLSSSNTTIAFNNQIILYGREVNTPPLGGKAYCLTATGVWVEQALPNLANGYKTMSVG